MADIVDINISQTVETVDIIVTPNLVTVNINQVTGGGGGDTNLGYTPSATNGIVTSDTGTDATIPLADNTNAGLLTPAEKTKLSGIAAGAEVNVNADWNATSGDAQILNKPTIPSISNLVPYIGASTDVDLGEFELKVGQVTLDTTPTGTAAVGTTRWNDALGISETTLKGGNVILKNGVDLVARIVNKVTPNTTLTKANYQAVRVSGATGQRLSVELARANSDLNSADTIGLVTETIATNEEGFIITVGQLENVNTTGSLQSETWADGDVLYLSPSVAGKLTNIKPNGSNGHIIVIGYVEYSHANNGKIYVKIMNGWELDELHNVYINNALNDDFLQYESSTQLWKNKQLTDTLIKAKLGISVLSGSNTGDNATNSQYSGLASSKQDTLVSATNIKTINGNSILGSGDLATIPFLSPYSMIANNTNASAIATQQAFKSIAQQTYTGTIVVTATTSPSGATNHSYTFTQVGKLVTLRINLDYANTGTTVSAIACELPSDCPTPELPTGVTTAGDVIVYGTGTMSANRQIVGAMGIMALRLKTSSIFELVVTRTGASFNKAYYSIQYFTA